MADSESAVCDMIAKVACVNVRAAVVVQHTANVSPVHLFSRSLGLLRWQWVRLLWARRTRCIMCEPRQVFLAAVAVNVPPTFRKDQCE